MEYNNIKYNPDIAGVSDSHYSASSLLVSDLSCLCTGITGKTVLGGHRQFC